jgi:hypothetical protein
MTISVSESPEEVSSKKINSNLTVAIKQLASIPLVESRKMVFIFFFFADR